MTLAELNTLAEKLGRSSTFVDGEVLIGIPLRPVETYHERFEFAFGFAAEVAEIPALPPIPATELPCIKVSIHDAAKVYTILKLAGCQPTMYLGSTTHKQQQ
jgi:hypothetical protein